MKPRAKTTVEECAALDARALARAGYLEPGTNSGELPLRRGNKDIGRFRVAMREGGLRLDYEVSPSEGATTGMSYVVAVVRTPAINQGERVWFSCPRCHKRASKLYLPPGKNVFLCRTCHSLTYASRQKRVNIWQKVRSETPRLEEDLLNPRLGLKRRLDTVRKIEKLQAQVESATILTMNQFGPYLPPSLRDAWTQRVEEAPPQPTSAAPGKRPRGRPKEKRPYQRRTPFHQSQRRTPAEAFCVKCRAYREPTEWKLVTFRNGRPAVQGVCPSCGSKTACIVTARVAALLASIPAKPTGGAELYDELLGLTPPPDHAR